MSTSFRLAATLAAASLVSGCAVFKPAPQELDLGGSVVTAVAPHPIPVLNITGAGKTVGKGAAIGATAGVTILPWAVPMCAALGPAAGWCFVYAVPAATGLGIGGSAIANKANAEPREVIEARREVVVSEMAAADSEKLLAASIRKTLQARRGVPVVEAATGDNPSPWKLEVSIKNVAMSGAIDDPGFALRVRGKLFLRRTSDNRVVYRADMLAMSDDRVVPVTPDADPSVLIRSRLERGAQLVGEKLVARLLSRTQTPLDAEPDAGDSDEPADAETKPVETASIH